MRIAGVLIASRKGTLLLMIVMSLHKSCSNPGFLLSCSATLYIMTTTRLCIEDMRHSSSLLASTTRRWGPQGRAAWRSSQHVYLLGELAFLA